MTFGQTSLATCKVFQDKCIVQIAMGNGFISWLDAFGKVWTCGYDKHLLGIGIKNIDIVAAIKSPTKIKSVKLDDVE